MNQTNNDRARRKFSPVVGDALRMIPFVVGASAIWIVSDMERPPVPNAFSFLHSDKFLHASAYATLAVLAAFGPLGRRERPRVVVVVATLLATLYGAVDEFHQSFVVGRQASGLDLVADFVGALIGGIFSSRFAPALVKLIPRSLIDEKAMNERNDDAHPSDRS